MNASPAAQRALSWLIGARLQRIDSPRPDLFALSLFARGVRQTLLLSLVAPLGAGLVHERPRGDAATPFVTKLRTKIENARVANVEAWRTPDAPGRAHALELTLTRSDATLRLLADFHPQHPNLILLSDARTIVFSLHEGAIKARQLSRSAPYVVSGKGRGVELPDDMAQLARIGTSLGEHATHSAQHAQRKALLQTTRAQRKRVERRVAAIRDDLERAQRAPQLRREAETLLCHLDAVPRGASSVTLSNVSTGEALDIVLDPAKSAIDNANARFEKAKKLDRGLTIARTRLGEAEHELAAIVERMERIEAADDAELQALTPSNQQASKPHEGRPRTKGAPRAEHKAYRIFETPLGRVLVGKGAVDNDTLTLTVARPHDHWLHARSVHGAHVVIPLERGQKLAPELLLDAAHLAAHFSDARGESQLEIQHTERRYVRKGKKSAPGAVQLEREKVLLLRVEAQRVARLLKSERLDPAR